MAKPRVLLALYNDTATKGIFDTASIDALAAAAGLDLVHASPINAPGRYFGRVYQWPILPRRMQAWVARYQLHLLPFTRQHYPERLADPNLWQGLMPLEKRLLALCDHRLGRAVVGTALDTFLTRTNPLRSLLDRRYDAIVCVTGLKDPLYEDLMRWGRARGIPVFAITQNWDNINYKPMMAHPDLLGVWGMQSYYIARLLHGFNHAQLVPVGAARMDVYFAPLPAQAAARAHFRLPEDKRVLLFAGSGPQFDETAVIERLDAAAGSGELPKDLLILYKPHPRRVPRPLERPLDLAQLPHVRLVPPTGPDSVNVADMPMLLRAVDAVVSPYSTLLLEAALCGRPCLAIAYDDSAHPAVKWETVRSYIHLTPLAFARWAVTCADKDAVVADTARLLALVGNEDLARRARDETLHVLFHDGRSFGSRVADAVTALLTRRRSA